MKINELKTILENKKISISKEALDELEDLMESTLLTNEKFNLTAIKDRDSFVEKMILDSILGLEGINIENKTCIDIGTGAGFPGMVLYILTKNSNITLLDSTNKKIEYLKEFAAKRQYFLNFVCDRVEVFAQKNREKFDYVFVRAVSSLNILLELCMPLLKVGGILVAYKGSDYMNEIRSSSKAFHKLSCSVDNVILSTLPESKENRAIIHIKKNKTSSVKYPRDYSEIKKKPL